MTDFDTEMAALTGKFARDLILVVKLAALEAVAEVLKGEAGAPHNEPVVADAVASAKAEIDDGVPDDEGDSEPKIDTFPPRGQWPERPPSPVADRILFFVRAKPGQRSQDIRAALGLDREELREAIEMLLADARIVKDGRGGGITYRPR
jgi:hypothetical protein